MRKLYFFIFVMFLVLPSASIKAETLDALSIINKAKNVYESRSVSQKVTITTKEGEKITGQMVAGEAYKHLPDGSRLLLVLLEPEGIKGVAYLFQEQDDHTIDQWVYIPFVGRVRKISGGSAYESFLGTDFSYADLGSWDLRDTYKLLGEQEIQGAKAYKIESVPWTKNFYYSRTIIWIAKDSFLPLRRDYYDLNNSLWKQQLFETITVINKKPTPLLIRMVDLKGNTSTELSISEVNPNIEVANEMFIPEQLEYALKCPAWEKVCYPLKK